MDKLRSTLTNYAMEIVTTDISHYLCGVCGAKTPATEVIDAIQNSKVWHYHHDESCPLYQPEEIVLSTMPADYIPEALKTYRLLDHTVMVDDVSGGVVSCEDKETGFMFEADIDQFRKFASLVHG
jgi:hypothetical protein